MFRFRRGGGLGCGAALSSGRRVRALESANVADRAAGFEGRRRRARAARTTCGGSGAAARSTRVNANGGSRGARPDDVTNDESRALAALETALARSARVRLPIATIAQPLSREARVCGYLLQQSPSRS